MKTNVPIKHVAHTHEGGRADAHQTPLIELERTIATCLLFENTFKCERQYYRRFRSIEALCTRVDPVAIASLAIKARTSYKLRHVPLFLALQLVRNTRNRQDSLVSDTLAAILKRPDELGEFLALYWKQGKIPIAAQIKKGLRRAFEQFSEYQLAKWDRDAAVKLRDIMFLVHPKASSANQLTYNKLANKALESADTWEVALSAGKDKRETWERLLKEQKLGYSALLMNLRNMLLVNVSKELIEEALLKGAPYSKALPFRFISAAAHAPALASAISTAMCHAASKEEPLPGSTVLLVDVSGSMDAKISAKSELSRIDAASALAILLREICKDVRVFTFSNSLIEVPNYQGLALAQAISVSQRHGGTYLTGALSTLQMLAPEPTRIIIVTDEQSHDGILANWAKSGYLCNVAPYAPGLDTKQGWQRINGWSERIVDWIRYAETEQ